MSGTPRWTSALASRSASHRTLFWIGLLIASLPLVARAFEIESASFDGGGAIPPKHTCEGDDVSPSLHWSDPPQGTVTFALIVDDPDAPDPSAPKVTWVHWVLYDIPAGSRELPENAGRGSLPEGTRQGSNSWGRVGYGGPCPPIGTHRYFHKLYALDAALGDLGEIDKPALERAMKDHVLGKAEIVGTYRKDGR
jgi:Raf kinase inhibitor-like YbhB/YbcL family protein